MTFPQRHHGMTQRAAGGSRPGPEPEGMSVRGITLIAFGLLVAVAIAMFAVRLLEAPMARDRPNPIEPDAALPWARDWVHPGTDLQEVQARSKQRLTTTEWLDRDAGLARIDIDTAMRLLAEQENPPSQEGVPPPSRGAEAPEPTDQDEAPAGADGVEGSGAEPPGADPSDEVEHEAADPSGLEPPGTVGVPSAAASSFILHPSSFHSDSSFLVHHASFRGGGRLPEALRIPPRAATAAGMIDAVTIGLAIFSALLTLGVAAAIVFFVARYHARRVADRSNPPSSVLSLELAWIIIPVLIALGLFVWSGAVFLRVQRPPRDIEGPMIWAVGKQWMWKFVHENGREEINTLHVPVGQDVRLALTSQDVIHSLYLPAFRLKQDVLPGRYTTIWFRATRPGEYHLFCAEYCGEEHSKMRGRLVVMSPADYARWEAGQAIDPGAQPEIGRAGSPEAPLATPPQGEGDLNAFWRLGCAACHLPTSSQRAPRLDGLWMGETRLEGGARIIADANYIRESILRPDARIVAGYPRPTIMPSYDGLVTEGDLIELMQFIQRLEHGWPPELLERARNMDIPEPPRQAGNEGDPPPQADDGAP